MRDDDHFSINTTVSKESLPKEQHKHTDPANVIEDGITQVKPDECASLLKRWCAITLFSAICFGSACDAAKEFYYYTSDVYGAKEGSNRIITVYQSIDPQQKWMIACPCIVMTLSLIIFLLHLSSAVYPFISGPNISLVCSLSIFLCCVSNLVMLQHSEDSLAVNHVGEVVSANLYYSSWALTYTSGVNFGICSARRFMTKPKPLTVALWFGMVKICLIIFGSAGHVWLTIGAVCKGAEGESYLDSFQPSMCWRSKFSLGAGALGVVLSFVTTATVAIEWKHALAVQAFMSAIFVHMFSFGAATITGMGGPAQSVGDLYYATWLAFACSLVVSASCIQQFKQQNDGSGLKYLKSENTNRHESKSSFSTSGEDTHSANASYTERQSSTPFVAL